MSSASSTARWIDCTVDSILTTTPFFSPREGCEPIPSTSMEPSRPTSPTRATTFEVPMSSPTMRFRSERLSIPPTVFFRSVGRSAAPSNCKPVRVAHVDIGDIAAFLSDELQSCVDKLVKPFIDLAASQPDRHAVRQIEFPRPAGVEPHRGQSQSGLDEPALRRQVTLRHGCLLALRARELGQLGWDVTLILRKQLAARVEKPALAPARRGHLLYDQHMQATRPRALHTDSVNPGQCVDRFAHRIEIHAQQAGAANLLLHDPLDVNGRHALEATGYRHRLDRLIQGPGHNRGKRAYRGDTAHGHPQRPPVDVRELPAALRLLATIFLPSAQHTVRPQALTRVKLVSSTRQTSSSKSMPEARAAIGTRLWSVMPGIVLTSSSSGRPVVSVMKSALPQPLAPT